MATSTDGTCTARGYSSPLAELRGKLRAMIRQKLAERTGRPKARMGWSVVGYAHAVVVRGRLRLVGWPVWADIPFGDLSAVPGGEPVMEFLTELWNRGELRFEDADAAHIDLARRRPLDVLPGHPVELPAPQCWGRYPRNDLKLARFRPKTNPLGLPLKKGRMVGAITPKLILDEIDDADEVSSDGESI
ncbi:hypothetical protein K466DRAFT_559891 [Polyporus arcularius HHB13444]|uniref:Uncharacterized protein n=1 Tax=Polyporus arcularius HHB13444 TaxID=1314778 RepID=A0A5C3NSV0_9APHY|nr:hypothetical protein K466DRAFT_559891 [Polyporus arcularius HHB13444]